MPVEENTEAFGMDAEGRLPAIEIGPLEAAEDAAAFRSLNEEWITRYFTLEKKDRELLENPEGEILAKGGHIFLARASGQVVGCVALLPIGGDVYELSKMAVLPALRGLGLGRQLLHYAIEQAKCLGATSLFLGSSQKLKNAVHLYESFGFEHVPPHQLPPMPYTRADVFMELPLGAQIPAIDTDLSR